MDRSYDALLVAVIGAVTIAIRILPFIVFGGKRKTPEYVTYLGKVLPYAIMGMLVIYCLRNVSVVAYPFGIPEFIACAVVAVLHIWKRNTLLSIAGGTAIYMVIVQMVI